MISPQFRSVSRLIALLGEALDVLLACVLIVMADERANFTTVVVISLPELRGVDRAPLEAGRDHLGAELALGLPAPDRYLFIHDDFDTCRVLCCGRHFGQEFLPEVHLS